MQLRRFLGFCLALQGSATALYWSTAADAVTQYKTEQKPFSFDISPFTTALKLTVKDDVENLKMPLAVMLQRLEKAPADETVEPLTVMVGSSDTQITAMAEKLASSGKEDLLAEYIKRQIKQAPSVKDAQGVKTIAFNHEAFNYIDYDALAEVYAKPQHNLLIDTAPLKKDRALRREFMHELVPFLSKNERQAVQNKINEGQDIDVNTELLPEFARSMVKKFIIYRGPNCFHAALAFQSPLLTSSSLINVKREPGYHRAMINYDELWRVLNQEFYEVNPSEQHLKYGDMVVMFDVPKDQQDNLKEAPDFRWIRHTATYLFGGYTFSKGSKSPNTPYSVRTLAEEWKTWKHFTKNLGVKVFRRSSKAVSRRPPIDQSDWIY